ncbi:uncharacterized protein [Amphiura filiformis]|uniref:uncharacterized protein n=1 Tax=Amphiura filiformis TaxID=82378 RepID=UPI003B20EABE
MALRFASSVLLVTFFQSTTIFAPYVDQETTSVTSYIGGAVSIRCDIKYVYADALIIWYHDDRSLYISSDETINTNVPSELANRVSVTCSRLLENGICTLTISGLTSYDDGTYKCGYIRDRVINFLGTVNVEVIPGDPPSEDSPICEILTVVSDGTGTYYTPSPSGHSVGDTIFLRCSETGASVKPTFLWQRGLNNDVTTLTSPIQGLSLQHEVDLVAGDIGATFTCVMNHPLLETPWTCSLIPLPQPSTPNPPDALNPTNEHLTLSHGKAATTFATTKQLPTTPMKNAQPTDMTKPYSRKNQSHTLSAVLAVVFILIIASVTGIILVLVWRKRNRKIPRPDYVLTIEKDCSITPDYSVVNAPDSIDKARQLSPKTILTTQKQSSTDENFNNESPKGTMNYNGCIQDGLLQHVQGTSQKDELTYAELELPEISHSNTLARIAQSQQDATVYADIQGTL